MPPLHLPGLTNGPASGLLDIGLLPLGWPEFPVTSPGKENTLLTSITVTAVALFLFISPSPPFLREVSWGERGMG